MLKKNRQVESNPLEPLEQAALRNAPLSVGQPEDIGQEPMARGRFLVPSDGEIVVENLQVPGRQVKIHSGSALDAYFQHDGDVYQFRTRVLEMDTPVRLNDTMIVRGVRIAAPTKIERGNRRQIYRQSFASVNPRVKADIWAIPHSLLTPRQLELVGKVEEEDSKSIEQGAPGMQFLIERGEAKITRPHAANAVAVTVPGLNLTQSQTLLAKPSNWQGEIADASEFGLGFVVHNVVYSRFKVFQPLLVRFKLPDVTKPIEFMVEVRRVQELNDGARVGGLLMVDSKNQHEITSARALAQFALQIQRDRVRGKRGP